MRILYVGNDLSEQSKYHSAYATLKKNLIKEGFKVIGTSSKKNQLLRLMDMILTVFRYVKKIDYIIIDVFSTSAFYYALIISQLARIFNVKYIPVLHGGNLPNRLNKNPLMCNLIFNNSYVNISPSEYLKTAFKDFGYDSLLIPNTINIKEYFYKKRNVIEPKLLYVRAFASIYNPLMTIDVLYQLKNKYPKATLCMVGPDRDGSLNDIKKRILELNLESSVIITGVLPKADWHKLSEDYDVFINTTNVDNTPVSLIEAMALGLPIVSTNVGGIPFLMTNNEDSFLVEPSDVNSMTNAIFTLLENNKTTSGFSEEGRTKAENMDWEVIKHQWYKILK